LPSAEDEIQARIEARIPEMRREFERRGLLPLSVDRIAALPRRGPRALLGHLNAYRRIHLPVRLWTRWSWTRSEARADYAAFQRARYRSSPEVASDLLQLPYAGRIDGRLTLTPRLALHLRNLMAVAEIAERWGARSLLEVGSGTGINLAMLRLLVPHVRLASFDVSLNRLWSLAATERVVDIGLGPRFVSDVEAIAAGDRRFDIVLSHFVLIQLPGREDAALQEMMRVARIGVVLCELSPEGGGWSGRRFLRTSGLSSGVADAVRRLPDAVVERFEPRRRDRLTGRPNVLIAVRRSDAPERPADRVP
jgi:SAM-dependent methyltransferase